MKNTNKKNNTPGFEVFEAVARMLWGYNKRVPNEGLSSAAVEDTAIDLKKLYNSPEAMDALGLVKKSELPKQTLENFCAYTQKLAECERLIADLKLSIKLNEIDGGKHYAWSKTVAEAEAQKAKEVANV